MGEKEQETAQVRKMQNGEKEVSISPTEKVPTEEKENEEREETSLNFVDKTVPTSALRKVYKEMKKWKEKYRAAKALEPLLAEKEAKIEELRSLISEIRINKALHEAAKEQGAISPEQVVQFLMGSIRLGDDLLPYVIGQDGKIRTNADNRPLSVEEFVKEFLTKYPHHKKATLPGGSGSSHAPISAGKTLVEKIKSATSQKELEEIVCPRGM